MLQPRQKEFKYGRIRHLYRQTSREETPGPGAGCLSAMYPEDIPKQVNALISSFVDLLCKNKQEIEKLLKQ